jgi:hypothetical protein
VDRPLDHHLRARSAKKPDPTQKAAQNEGAAFVFRSPHETRKALENQGFVQMLADAGWASARFLSGENPILFEHSVTG